MIRYVLTALAGAALAFFLDPDRGAYRRNTARDRFLGTTRRGGDVVSRTGRKLASETYGATQKLKHRGSETEPENDEVLVSKVMSEAFRDRDLPKGRVNINAVDGIVYLRGELDDTDQIKEIEARVRRVSGVRDVANLLRHPGTPLPERR
jgi:osmotically-inducible protein OsmY